MLAWYRLRGHIRPFSLVVVGGSLLLILGALSCSDQECTCPEPTVPLSGRAVIDASVRVDQQGHLYSEGFSFSRGAPVTLQNSQGIAIDFFLAYSTGVSGEFQGYMLGEPTFSPRFFHVGYAGTLEEARALFQSTTCVPDDAHFEKIAGTVGPYDVWVVKTHDGKFGKILIVDAFFCSTEHDSAGIAVERSYAEITFDWQYQPNGSRCFE